MLDVLITGAAITDGSGIPARRGSVGIRAGARVMDPALSSPGEVSNVDR